MTSLRGRGLSAYQIWIQQGNVGTEADFLASLVGATGAKGDTGDIGVLSAYTEKTAPVDADLIPIADSAAFNETKKIQIGNLPVFHKSTSAEIYALTEKTSPVDADLLVIEDSAASNAKKKIQIGNLPFGSAWFAITAFSGTPASTSTITTSGDLTGTLAAGMPLRYNIGGVYYYGIITAITSSLITIAGAPLSGTILALAYGNKNRVVVKDIKIYGYWNDGTNTSLITSKLGTPSTWEHGQAALVQVKYRGGVIDSGATQPTMQITNAGSNVLSSAVTPTASQQSTVVALSTTYYLISKGSAFEIVVASDGTNKDSWNLGVEIMAVLV